MGSDRTSSPERRLGRGVRRGILVLAGPLALAGLIVACGGGAVDSGEAGGAPSTTAAPSAATDTGDIEGTEDADGATDTTEAAGSEAAETTATEPSPVDPVVFADDFGTSIQPIFANRCGACHSPGGPGSPHWQLGTAAELAADHTGLAQVIGTGYMPPWPAAGDSPAFHQDRSLRPDQIQAVLDWSAAGAPLDVSPDTVIESTVEVVGLQDPDAVLAPPAPYAGSPETVDDYRCQIYEVPNLPDGGFLTAYEFIPDRPEVVHHAIGYLLPAEARSRADARDGEDGRPGWSCFGSSGIGQDEILIGWAPGQLPTVYPEGTGVPLEPGAFFVIQIHYHYEGQAPADGSTLAVEVASPDEGLEHIEVSQVVGPAEIPCSTDEVGPLCDRDAALAAAIEKYGEEGVQADRFLRLCRASVADFAAMTDGRASSSCDLPAVLVGAVGEVVSVLGHQHEIGEWFKLTLNPGQDDERVLLDIPNWDFDWQYNYEPVDRILIGPEDVLRIECGWDRRRRNPDLEPAYVLWADGTNDEMCFGTITTRPPS